MKSFVSSMQLVVFIVETVITYNLLFLDLVALSGPSPVQSKEPLKFSLDSLLETALPALHPIVAAGSNKCESLKSFFGITYDQMQEKTAPNFYDAINMDLITRKGNVKYNLTDRLGRVLKNAQHIVILIHGFLESSDGVMVQAIAPEYMNKNNITVFALDGKNALTYEYFRSSTYVRFVGEKLGSILNDIISNGHDPNDISLIGHSLGAHIAGIAGKQVLKLSGRQIGRITALDPAGPCFTATQPDNRLDRNDASYVDVIHTNAGLLGIKEAIGHKDFFPNGGWSQPGCILSTCDHSRVWQLYAESVRTPDKFPGRKCDSWKSFREGLCSMNELAYMGLNSPSGSSGSYFLSTAAEAPFGLGAAGSG